MKAFFILFIAVSLFTSCHRYVTTCTNSFADSYKIPCGFPYGSSFAIQPEQDPDSLFTKEVVHKIAEILTCSGFRMTECDRADYLLTFNFGQDCETRIVNVPNYIPGPIETKTGKVISKDGPVEYEEKIQGPGSVIFTPEAVNIFHRKLAVTVFDRNKNRVWEGNSESSGSNGDLRAQMDYLLVSSFQYFGLNTTKNISMRIKA